MICTSLFIELTTHLLNKCDFNFILSGRFTQDCIENLCSVLRMKNCVLNALQLNNLKLITISHNMQKVSCGSYDHDDKELLPDFLNTIKNMK